MSIGSDLLRFSNRKLVFFDFESQRICLVQDNLPFQCGFCVGQRNKVLSRHNHYLHWPGYIMSPDAARITRFQQSWVDNGEDPEVVLDAFESYAMDEEYLLVGHAIFTFDCGLWNLWREALGLPRTYTMLPRVIDTNLLSRAYKEGWKPDRENLLAWQFKVAASPRAGVKTNLTQMCKDLKIEVDETKTHDALYDLYLNQQVYWELVNRMDI